MTREEEIKAVWSQNRHPWPGMEEGRPERTFRIARRMPPSVTPASGDPKPAILDDSSFLYVMEDGAYRGQPAVRIVCDGVVLETITKSQS